MICSIVDLLGLALRVPDHTTLSRRSATPDVPWPSRRCTGAGGEAGPLHLLVDSAGLKLCGPGEEVVEKHGTRTRRLWWKLHLGLDTETGQIVAASLTAKEMDDSAKVAGLLDQVAGSVASVAGDDGYDQDGVYADVAVRHPGTAVVVPPRATAVPSETAETAPTQRDRRLQQVEPRGSPDVAEHGRVGWQKATRYTRQALAEAAIGRWKQVIGDKLRAHTDERRATEVEVAVHALNRMLEFGHPKYVRTA